MGFISVFAYRELRIGDPSTQRDDNNNDNNNQRPFNVDRKGHMEEEERGPLV